MARGDSARLRCHAGTLLACVSAALLAAAVLAAIVVALVSLSLPGADGRREGFSERIFPAVLTADQQRQYRAEDARVIARLRGQLVQVDPVLRRVQIYSSAHQSYTDQKQRIYLRLRDRRGRLYPDRVLRLVLLHEAAHQISKGEWGHGRVFTANFRRLLARAARLGVDVAQEREVPPEYIDPSIEH